VATTIEMPQMGFDMHEGTIVRWRKNEGDDVSRGEIIAEIQTDKAVVDMEAYVGGVMGKIVVAEGETVPVGSPIAIIVEPGEEVPVLEEIRTLSSFDSLAAAEVRSESAELSGNETEAESLNQKSDSTRVKASPLAKKMAKDMGLDLSRIRGTGPGGRILKEDILQASDGKIPPTLEVILPVVESKVRDPEMSGGTSIEDATEIIAKNVAGTEVVLSKMRLAIGARTSQSVREAPHYYVTTEVDMGQAWETRRELNQSLEDNTRVSLNDMVIRACIKAIKKFPAFNASIRGNQLIFHPHINIGIAIDMEEGLIIASVAGCESRDLIDLSKATRDVIARAQNGKLTDKEYTGATFTVSNMGMLGVDSFTAIINPPNSAVLAVGAVLEKPVVKNGAVVVARMMKITVSSDHRVIDGADAARFAQEIRRLLERPLLLIV
jgi:pyruvate dehydrogenase E2 component (dihydrolipoamide acetyltransferase)